MKLSTSIMVAAGALLASAVPFAASAVPITGTINLAGDFQPTISGVPTQNMAQANSIDVLPAGGGTGTFSTLVGSGSLATVQSSPGGVMKDFTFSPFVGPINTFYTITVGGTTVSFDLLALSISNQNASFLTLSGSGTLHETGFDNTPGTFFFSGNSTNGASPGATFSFSAGSQATAAPEPMSMALLGVGVLALGLVRRRKH